MGTLRTRLITAEEFEKLPNDHLELVRGEAVEMTPPAFEHGEVVGSLFARLHAYIERHRGFRIAVNDPGFILERGPDTVRGPDIAVVRGERMSGLRADRFLPLVPDLVAEVASPSEDRRWREERADLWIGHGVRLVYMVEPDLRRVVVHEPGRPPRTLGEEDALTGGDVLPGFSTPVRALFA